MSIIDTSPPGHDNGDLDEEEGAEGMASERTFEVLVSSIYRVVAIDADHAYTRFLNDEGELVDEDTISVREADEF